MALNTYLTFDGNCREAFEFYRSVFGGEFAEFRTFGDGPPDMPVSEAEKRPRPARRAADRLERPDGQRQLELCPPTPLAVGNNFSLSIEVESREQCDELFAKLSAGGSVVMPLQEMFWGAYFGQCTDREQSVSTGWSTTRCPPSERAGGSHGLHRPGVSGGTTQAVSMPAAPSSSSSAVAISRIRNFWTLPVTVMGNASTSFQ